MKKIIVFNMVTVDGYFAGPNGEIDWHNTDEEFGKFADEQTKTFGGIIMGRTTYDLMAGYWPTDEGQKDSPIVADIMCNVWKLVFSKKLGKVEDKGRWKNVNVFNKINKEEVLKWKQYEGADLAIFGSGTIVRQFADLGLIDEYRLMVAPIILGRGKLLFEGVKKEKLKLKDTRKFGNGNILLTYTVNQ